MKATITGLMALFNAGGDFYNDVSGRLFHGEAPEGVEYPYAVFFIISDTDDDTFSEELQDIYIQFSLFSGASSSAEILDMNTHLKTMFNKTQFAVTGNTVIIMNRLQTNGPTYTPADVVAGTGFYWQTDVDYEIHVQKN